MRELAPSELSVRVDRLDALFQETPFMTARPDLDPGPALDHLVRRVDFGLRRVTRNTTVRVHLSSEPVTADLQWTAARAVTAYCLRRARESRAAVRSIRRSGWRAMFLASILLAVAMSVSLTLTHFEPLPAPYNELVSDAFVIAGWVLLWRPLELLFYEWIEPWRDAKDFERLAELPLELRADGA